MPHRFPRLFAALLAATPLLAQTTALTVDTSSREEVRQFFRAVYSASDGVPMNWTGSYPTGTPGDTANAFKEATRLRINFFRALAGVPAAITFNSTSSAKDQQAALMMSANNALDHFPPTSWTFYTADGAEAAGKSNLAIGEAGPDAITGYISDAGANNAALGHRRWLLYPQTQQMGTGDVPGDATHSAANATWILDSFYGTTRPTTRTVQVPYPPAGFVPYQLVFPRWSFTYPGADFSAATVTMTRAGQSVAVAVEPLTSNVGEPTLAWVYGGLSTATATPHVVPATDTTYAVNVANVRINGAPQNFSYNVTVFDPAVAGPDATPVGILAPPLITAGITGTYTVAKPGFAGAFDWRTVQLAAYAHTFTGESGLDGLTAITSPGYNVVQSILVGSGAAAYRLAHIQPVTEALALPGQFFVRDTTAALALQSRIGVATADEVAHVQISTDDGNSWSDVYTQAGTSPISTTPGPTENTFVARTVSLAAYAGRTVQLRLLFTTADSGTIFVATPTNTTGWFIDNLTVTGLQAATPGSATRVSTGTSFTLAPPAEGAFALQARGVMFGAYPLEWGPVAQLNAATGAGGPTSRLSNLSVRTTMAANQTLFVGLTMSDGTRNVLLRAAGPALTAFGLTTAMPSPQLDLYDSTATLKATNSAWDPSLAAVFSSVSAFSFPAGSHDAALVENLNGGYTAQVHGTNAGVVLVEAYDLGTGNSPRLTNVSARNIVGTGENILIAGFNITGTGSKRLLIRAVGPKLSAFGVNGFLANPRLDVFDGDAAVAGTTGWDSSLASTFASVGAFPLDSGSKDAALVVTLKPGTYTVQVKGADGGTGEALVEIYEVP